MDEVGGKGVLLLHSVRFPAGQSRAQRSWAKDDSTGTEAVPPSLGVRGLPWRAPRPCCSVQLSAAQRELQELWHSLTASLIERSTGWGQQGNSVEHGFVLTGCCWNFSHSSAACHNSAVGREGTLSPCTAWQHGGLGTAPLFCRGACAFPVLAPGQLSLPSDILPSSSPPERAGRHVNPFTLTG